jgi:hypothetical protein
VLLIAGEIRPEFIAMIIIFQNFLRLFECEIKFSKFNLNELWRGKSARYLSDEHRRVKFWQNLNWGHTTSALF